jgi:hypothetical protein
VVANGRIVEFGGGDTTMALVRQLARTFEELFPPIPAGGAAPGLTWVDTATSTIDNGGIELHVTSIAAREVVGWISYAGVDALHMTAFAKYTISGQGTQMGQEITIDGTGIRRSHHYLAAAGAYLGGWASDSSNMHALVASVGLSIPIVQIRADSLIYRSR